MYPLVALLHTCSLQEFPHVDIQALADSQQANDRQVMLTTLHTTHVAAIYSGFMRKRFLRQIGFGSQCAYRLPDSYKGWVASMVG